MRGEIVSDFAVDAAFRAGKRVAFPRVEVELSFREAASPEGPWERGPFGIREPRADAPLADFDALPGPILVIAPGVAFDRAGGRLGHGKGYYDRFLRGLRSRRSDVFVTALCVPCQVVDRVPMYERDERVDAVCAGGSFFRTRAPA
jgi:5-formyltetrahydrofolate cyclo-ligase